MYLAPQWHALSNIWTPHTLFTKVNGIWCVCGGKHLIEYTSCIVGIQVNLNAKLIFTVSITSRDEQK